MLVRVRITVFLNNIILFQLVPQAFVFQPFDSFIQVVKRGRLVLPTIGYLGFVLTNVLLATVITVIHNSQVTAVYDTGMCRIFELDRQNSSGIVTVVIPIITGNLIKGIFQYLTNFFSGIILVVIVDFDIYIEIKANVGFTITGNHISA